MVSAKSLLAGEVTTPNQAAPAQNQIAPIQNQMAPIQNRAAPVKIEATQDQKIQAYYSDTALSHRIGLC